MSEFKVYQVMWGECWAGDNNVDNFEPGNLYTSPEVALKATQKTIESLNLVPTVRELGYLGYGAPWCYSNGSDVVWVEERTVHGEDN